MQTAKTEAERIARDPVREKQLTRRAALMVAEGRRTDKEICRELNIAVSTLQVWKRSPLFLELVNTYNAEIDERGIKAIVDDLMTDAPKNISFLKNVRDGLFYDKKDKMDLRLRAAGMLLNKQAPNPGEGVSDGAMKVVIGGRLIGQMLRAMKNDGAIDVTPEDADDPRIAVKTPEEFVQELHAREESEAREEAAAAAVGGSAADPDDTLD